MNPDRHRGAFWTGRMRVGAGAGDVFSGVLDGAGEF